MLVMRLPGPVTRGLIAEQAGETRRPGPAGALADRLLSLLRDGWDGTSFDAASEAAPTGERSPGPAKG